MSHVSRQELRETRHFMFRLKCKPLLTRLPGQADACRSEVLLPFFKKHPVPDENPGPRDVECGLSSREATGLRPWQECQNHTLLSRHN